MSATLHNRQIPGSRESCIHEEAVHSRKMEGIHTGLKPRKEAVHLQHTVLPERH